LPFCFPIIYHGNAIKKRKKCNKGYGNRKQKYSIIGKSADKIPTPMRHNGSTIAL
jgi:hypothetical protein